MCYKFIINTNLSMQVRYIYINYSYILENLKYIKIDNRK